MTRFRLFLLPLAAACSSEIIGGSADVTAGECEGSPYDRALDLDTGEKEPVVWAEADGPTIQLHLDDLVANCCPEPEADVTRDGFALEVAFDDLVEGEYGCDCICYMDFLVEIEGNDAGTYTIAVDYHEETFEGIEIVVP
ncbi:MAG: hypothetical protein JXB39_16925 [Deltaproteobacteria bacterium]|nr:hypothetical protein [Deltaproteobacteria bacterium]